MDGVFNAFLGFDIQSSVLHELLGVMSRLSSTSAKIYHLPCFSSFVDIGRPSPGMTAVPQTQFEVQRLEQDLCRDQPRSRASGHPTPPPPWLQRYPELPLPASPGPWKEAGAKNPPS